MRKGVYTLEDLKARCEVDEDSGCWHWLLHKTKDGRAHLNLRLEGHVGTVSGRRAAALLAGKKIPAKHECYQSLRCHSVDCVNPAHVTIASRKKMCEDMAKRGRFNTPKFRLAIAARNIKARALTQEQVLEILSSTDHYKVQAARYGVAADTVRKILKGESYRSPMGNSVFALGALA